MSQQQAMKLVDDARSSLDNCFSEVKQGNLTDLGEFENIMAQLCEAIAKLPVDEIRQFEKPMRDISVNLQELSVILQKRRDELKDQMQGLSLQKRAQAAYKTSEKENK